MLAGSRVKPAPPAAAKRRLDQGGYPHKSELFGQKFGDSHLIGGIQHGRSAAARLQRLPRQPERREPCQIGTLER